MRRLLVTGASGFLGWHVCRAALPHWEVFGTFHLHPVEVPGAKMIQADLRKYRTLKALFQTLSLDAVIHTAAAANAEFCQSHPTESHRINVEASCHIAGLCAESQIPCAYTSTDLVFDGTRAPYREKDPLCPISTYGEHKAKAEAKMRHVYPEVIVARLPLLFGETGPRSGSFLQPMLTALKERKTLHLFADEFRTPVTAKAAASGLLLALESRERTIHLGGPEWISRYDFGKKIWTILKADLSLLVPCRQEDRRDLAPRPKDVSLDSTLAFSLGYSPRPPEIELQDILKRYLMGL